MSSCKLALLGLAAALGAGASAPPRSGSAPARNWVLPLFTPEGHHAMTLRGSEVRPIDADRVDVVELNMTVFSGDAAARIVSVMLSPEANFFPRENRVRGEQSVRVIRFAPDGQIAAEITGDDWTYTEVREKVSIRRNTHVVFREQLTNILK